MFNLPVLTNLKVTVLCDFRVSLRLGWVQSRSIPKGVAMLVAGGPREPPRAPLHPNNLRSVFFTVAARTSHSDGEHRKPKGMKRENN